MCKRESEAHGETFVCVESVQVLCIFILLGELFAYLTRKDAGLVLLLR